MLTDMQLKLLVCPQHHTSLKILTSEEWDRLSARLQTLSVTTGFGAHITAEGGAICEEEDDQSATYFYPIAEGLLYLMPSDAVPLP